MLGCMKHKLESSLPEEISITSYMQMTIKIAGTNIKNLRYADDTTLMAESEEVLKELKVIVK